ncbi:MAG: hypothetical protein IKN91_00015 [Paludibacteraceae bacterium]|nr:hypothetical protein [Paludibacteraceae bacterium]
MRKPLLIVIAGPNGSGKTTITSRVIRHQWAESCEYINPDEVAQHIFGDWNDIEAIRKAVNYCDDLRERLLREHKDMIFETVLSSDAVEQQVNKKVEEGIDKAFNPEVPEKEQQEQQSPMPSRSISAKRISNPSQ